MLLGQQCAFIKSTCWTSVVVIFLTTVLNSLIRLIALKILFRRSCRVFLYLHVVISIVGVVDYSVWVHHHWRWLIPALGRIDSLAFSIIIYRVLILIILWLSLVRPVVSSGVVLFIIGQSRPLVWVLLLCILIRNLFHLWFFIVENSWDCGWFVYLNDIYCVLNFSTSLIKRCNR